MDYSQYGNPPYSYAPGASDPYAQPHQYQPTPPPQIRNPFAPPQVRNTYPGQDPGLDPEYGAQLAQWNSTYAPAEPVEKGKKESKPGREGNANLTPIGPSGPDDGRPGAAEDKKLTVVRKGGGTTWEDPSLMEWDPAQFRIMVGNLAGEVTDDSLAKAFAQYGVAKARVVRDKRTTKSKGYGFVSFTDGEQGFKAARQMVGKYIGSHPVTIQRSKTDLRPVAHKDNRNKHKQNKNQNKPRDKVDNEPDPLRAHTGAHIEKKPVRNPGAYKVIG